MKQKYHGFATYLTKNSILLLSVIFLIRIFEYIYLKANLPLNNSVLKLEFTGLIYDYFSAFVFIGTILLPISLLFFLIKKKLINMLFGIVASLYSLIQIILIIYLKNTYSLLGSDIFKYSVNELLFIVKSSSTTNLFILSAIIFIIVTGIMVLAYIITRKIRLSPLANKIILFLILASIPFLSWSYPKKSNFVIETDFSIVANKTRYFIHDIFSTTINSQTNVTLSDANHVKQIKEYWNYFPEFDFKSNDYPLLRKDTDNDVLSSFFNFNDTPPNFVFIIVEGLGKSFTGNNAAIGSFTPFIDSLEQFSLSWDNFLASSERTFGVLPCVFGSLPYGEAGFLELNTTMPYHNSLLKTLNNADYYSSFFYGGWQHFDNMDVFLKRNKIDYLIDDFGSYEKIPSRNADKFSWGYGDKALFNRALEIKKDTNIEKPFVDIFLTLSMHSPWINNEYDSYIQKAKERMQVLSFDAKKRKQLSKDLNVLSCIMYTDDALKEYFNKIKKEPYYSNTIFIITGDHRLHPIQRKSNIDIYHVPLIIYSEMLKDTGHFKSISSHQNIAPTINALLKNQNIETPKQIHFMEGVLDTAKNFRNKQIHAFMRNNKHVDQLIFKNYFLNDGQLYKINDGMTTRIVENKQVADSMKKFIEHLKYINKYVCENNNILPFNNFMNKNGEFLIINNHYNFDDKAMFKSNIKNIINENETNKALQINKDQEFVTLIKEFNIDPGIKQLKLSIELDVKTSDTLNCSKPLLVYTIKNDRQSLIWESAGMINKNHELNKWNKVVLSESINIMDLPEYKAFKAYFWNRKCNFLVDNIKVKVYGVK